MPETDDKCPYCGRAVKPTAVKCPHCREWLDEDDEPARPRPDYKPCPSCGARGAERIVWTFWGSFYGPGLMTHVRCPKCRAAYNGKTGKSNLRNILIFCFLVYGILLALVGLPVAAIIYTIVSSGR